MAPVMSPTVMIANMPWYIANTLVGIAVVPDAGDRADDAR